MQREIRWNVRSRTNPTIHSYLMLIVNTKTEAQKIKQKIIEEFQPLEEPVSLTEGKIKGERHARYKLIGFDSYRNSADEINWKKIYKGKVARDSTLYDRKNRDGLAVFVDNSFS